MNISPENSKIILYTSPDGKVKVDVSLHDETVWLNLNKIAELFETAKQNVSYHLQNIFNDRELEKISTAKEILTVQKEGERDVKRIIEYYNLDAIISVGYRINSERATQFRIWATKVLREYIIKGFTLDDERLKQEGGRSRYFDELLSIASWLFVLFVVKKI